MRILVTGAGGLLGGRLAPLLAPFHETTALVHHRPGPPGMATVSADLADSEAAVRVLEQSGAQAVIHCAALADPEVCEREPERARRENEIATRNLASACRRGGARLFFISTDLVFPGNQSFATESTPPRPLMLYGQSKLRAEAVALEEAEAVIVRVALVYGLGNGPRLSASEGIAQRLHRGEHVTLFEDEWRTPVDPESVADALSRLLARPTATGVFHLGGPERITRLALGERVAAVLGLDPALIRRSTRASHNGAPRPEDVSLDTSRARTELGWTPRSLEEGIREGRIG